MIDLTGKTILVAGVSNRKSVGWHVAERARAAGATLVFAVHSEARRRELVEKLPGEVFVCDAARDDEAERLARELAARHPVLHGLVHAIAFANYERGPLPFHETAAADFLEAVDVSAFSLVRLSKALKPLFHPRASVVTISISTTRMAAENYGFMGPAKAALDSAVVFLAKSFSRFSEVRFNAVCAGLLKTSSSAGIPGYVESFLYAERCTLRKRALETREVADTALFLLSDLASGINAQRLVVDAGMEVNFFDADVIASAMRPEAP
jgi:enoyl-[acyl-carrier protein] reductase I